MSTHDDPIVSLQNVEVHFEKNDSLFDLFSEPETVEAVDDVSLDIQPNDTIALIGESGCGKTTLGKTAIGLQRPTGGSVKYLGRDVWDVHDGKDDSDLTFSDIRQSLQIIHQDPGSSLNPGRTVLASLSEPLRRKNPEMDSDARRERILTMLQHVSVTPPEDYAQRYPHQLSGGEKQRVALVRALLMNPDLILADEAISALDVSLRVDMMDLMLELQEIFNTSYLFISHNLSNARYLAQRSGGRIGIMYLGKLVEIGTADEIINDPKHPYTKALKWATPSVNPDKETTDELPLRKIDIPDPVDPPSGCRFHTRCPEAREACTKETPGLLRENGGQRVACFREDEDHEYWSSPPLED